MPKGRPLEGSPGWRVIERPKQRSWRAGYVIVPVALTAGLLQIFVLSDHDWLGWAQDLRQELPSSHAPAVDRGKRATVAERAEMPAAPTERRIVRRSEPQGSPEARASRPTAAAEKTRAGGAAEQTAPVASAAAAPLRIVIQHTTGADNAMPALQLAAYLETHGFVIADIRAVGFDIGWPSVRYFFERDLPASQRLVAAVDSFFAKSPGRAPDEATDFTYFTPKPRPGNVEIWLPGHRGAGNQSS